MMMNPALWNWASPVWLVAAVIIAAYLLTIRTATRNNVAVLVVGVVFLTIAFVSPIGVLANGYLFSAHMIQHLLLLLVVPLLLVLSMPSAKTAPRWAGTFSFRTGVPKALPLIGWLCGVGAMWFWHVPSMCQASLQNPVVGGVQSVSLVACGLAFWWPIFAPIEQHRLDPLTGIVYLFSACLACTLLGIYITFTTISVCPAFANPVDRIGILSQLHNAGLTPGIDQHLGGLLMWVPQCALYVSTIICLLSRWYSAMEPQAGASAKLSQRAGVRT